MCHDWMRQNKTCPEWPISHLPNSKTCLTHVVWNRKGEIGNCISASTKHCICGSETWISVTWCKCHCGETLPARIVGSKVWWLRLCVLSEKTVWTLNDSWWVGLIIFFGVTRLLCWKHKTIVSMLTSYSVWILSPTILKLNPRNLLLGSQSSSSIGQS